MKSISTLLFLALMSVVNLMAPSPVLAEELNVWGVPCTSKKYRDAGRHHYLPNYTKIQESGVHIDKLQEMYCMTRVKCVALGYCKATNAAEQLEANKLKAEMAVEEARLKREQAAAAAEAAKREAQRKIEEERIRKADALKREQDRIRQEEFAASERRRKDAAAAETSKRLKVASADARRLVETRDEAQKHLPKNREMCTSKHEAYSSEIDMTPIMMVVAQAQKRHAELDRNKVCNGRPGTVGPLKCDFPSDFFGMKIASCKATVSCPAREEIRPCARGSAQ